MRELPPNRRPDLRHLLGRAEPVEPRHQRGVQARRDSQCWRRNGRTGALRFALALGLQHRLGHFLDEQRNAIGALNDVLLILSGSALLPVTRSIIAVDFALAESIKSEGGDIGPTNPRRLELRPIGDNQQHREVFSSGPPCDRSASRLVGSIQCTSSKIISTGLGLRPAPPFAQ